VVLTSLFQNVSLLSIELRPSGGNCSTLKLLRALMSFDERGSVSRGIDCLATGKRRQLNWSKELLLPICLISRGDWVEIEGITCSRGLNLQMSPEIVSAAIKHRRLPSMKKKKICSLALNASFDCVIYWVVEFLCWRSRHQTYKWEEEHNFAITHDCVNQGFSYGHRSVLISEGSKQRSLLKIPGFVVFSVSTWS
jgi:hypothetical protein